MKVFLGTLVHSLVLERIQVLTEHCIGFEEGEQGRIIFVEPASKLDELAEKFHFSKDTICSLSESQFLMPGMVDTHIHAPQYSNAGTGYDRQLLEWLKHYTYPAEERFADLEWARKVYPLVVKRTLRHGTTTACYFATIHLGSTQELCRVVCEAGQRALVGKVCMDREAPPTYVERCQDSIDDTRRLIDFISSMNNPLVQPIVTPRFAPTCSPALLAGLGEMARQRGTHIQSHISEQKDEVDYTLKLFPDYKNSSSIFERFGLLSNKTVLAHCVHLEEEEVGLLQERGVGVAHCPNSNLSLRSGILDVRKLLDRGMKIGLGTDVSGGYSPSILDAMRTAVASSRALSFTRPDGSYRCLDHHHAFFMGTLGGARVLGMEDKIGSFVVGKQFDALIVDTQAPPTPAPVFDTFDSDTFDDILMKFFYLGDDRNIIRVFVAGKEVSLD